MKTRVSISLTVAFIIGHIPAAWEDMLKTAGVEWVKRELGM